MRSLTSIHSSWCLSICIGIYFNVLTLTYHCIPLSRSNCCCLLDISSILISSACGSLSFPSHPIIIHSVWYPMYPSLFQLPSLVHISPYFTTICTLIQLKYRQWYLSHNMTHACRIIYHPRCSTEFRFKRTITHSLLRLSSYHLFYLLYSLSFEYLALPISRLPSFQVPAVNFSCLELALARLFLEEPVQPPPSYVPTILTPHRYTYQILRIIMTCSTKRIRILLTPYLVTLIL